MGVTTLKRVQNRSRHNVAVLNLENPGATGHGVVIAPGASLKVDMNVPWSATRNGFAAKHLRVRVAGSPRYWIWQAQNRDGDHVRFSTDGAWRDCGRPVDGISEPDGERTLVVLDDGFQFVLIPDEILARLRGLDGGHRLTWEAAPQPIPSVPKLSATAFSMAGPASDARNTVYRDSGKRYAFKIDASGVVVATDPNGVEQRLTEAVSYTRKRAGERHTAPPFDLVAAADGRVFAKARGEDRFYFAQMDELFMHESWRGVIPVPSSYFKRDPEANQSGRRAQDLTAHVNGAYDRHPHAERFPLFRALLEREAIDAMIVRVQPRVWHLIDPRPPSSPSWMLGATLAVIDWLRGLLDVALPDAVKYAVRDLRDALDWQVRNAREKDDAPPARVPSHPAVTYRAANGQEFTASAISFRRVLDIGVGHVHHHQQYEGITGGEIQPVRDKPHFTWAYQLFNGPVFDGDGYIDGTCNFYALVELGRPGSPAGSGYALLFQDEQSYFSKRWRLVGPDDGGKLLFALAANIDWGIYTFDRARFWDPFKAGHVGPKSRLAVAAQVLLVTGDDRPESRSRIYSLNCSWSTMDRSWRWRSLPDGAEVRYFANANGSEPIADVDAATVYPQTLRLRDDMTLHLKGTRRPPGADRAVRGRWYQRYLPASNALAPPAEELPANAMPGSGYKHPWRFMREALFEQADRFSHFGVYDQVDSRSQYYTVAPATAADERLLEQAAGQPWDDPDYTLYRWAPRFPWAAPFYLFMWRNLVPGVLDRKPPSFFSRVTRLRIVRRGDRWIAMHWDKRDDDLLPFGGALAANPFEFKPVEFRAARGGARARIRLTSHARVESPPKVARVELRWSGARDSAASLVLFPAAGAATDHLWRLRIAALDPARPGGVVRLLDADVAGRILPPGDTEGHTYRWSRIGDVAPLLDRYCTDRGAADHGTSVWLEDIVGHVAVPDEVRWVRTAPAVVTFGARLRLRHRVTGQALHSHPHNYEHQGSSRQQQVTCFAGYDDNDLWRVKAQHGQPPGARSAQPVRDGDVVRLEHLATGRNLHSHGGFPSPVTRQQEVTCFGEGGAGDGNDDWRVEVEGGGVWDDSRQVRLVHVPTGHALHSHGGFSHPKFTLGQQEVTGFAARDDNDLWYASECVKVPIGWLDEVSETPGGLRIRGWALDPDTSASIDVHVYVGGGFAAGARADRSRPDVGAAYPGFGDAHGFELTVPAGNGRHRVCVYAINVGRAGENPEIGCRTVTIEPDACAALRGQAEGLRGEIASLQAELDEAVGAEKAPILAQIRARQAELRGVTAEMTRLGCA